MKIEERNYGLDVLRPILMFMLATYHFFNYYGGKYVNPESYGMKAYVVQNIGWAGGRMICNVFLFISAWFLCEMKEFKVGRLIKVWFTVFVYSIVIGIAFYVRSEDKMFFISHFFPIATNLVWYATMYMGILVLSPLLNRLLEKNNREITRKICFAFFWIVCVIPTFYPKFARLGSVLSWFVLAYLIVGLLKTYNFRISRFFAGIIFLIGWISCLWFYNAFEYSIGNNYIMELLKRLGFYRGVYFADLATLPPFLSALGLFYLFKDCNFKLSGHGGVLRMIGSASLDVYIISSMESPFAKLAWVELLQPGFSPTGVCQCYIMIFIGITIGIVLGNIREFIWEKIMNLNMISRLFKKMDERMNQ